LSKKIFHFWNHKPGDWLLKIGTTMPSSGNWYWASHRVSPAVYIAASRLLQI